MYLSIKDDAIFVADAHFNKKNREFLTFLKKVESNEIITTQLFLMGDILKSETDDLPFIYCP